MMDRAASSSLTERNDAPDSISNTAPSSFTATGVCKKAFMRTAAKTVAINKAPIIQLPAISSRLKLLTPQGRNRC